MSFPPPQPPYGGAPPEPALTPGEEDAAENERRPSAEGRVGIPRSAVGPLNVLVGLLITAVAIFIGQLIVATFDPDLLREEEESTPGGLLGAQLAVVAGMIFAALAVTAHLNREGWWAALRRLGVRSAPVGLVASTALAAFGLYLVAALAINLSFSPEQQDIAENLGATREAEVWIKVLAGIVIIAGASLGEELLFRGFVFGGLRQRMSLWPAAVVSGLLFGVLHLTAGNFAVALQLTAFGVILAWAYERSGSLWAPILLHAFNNTVAFSLLISDAV